MALDQLGYIGGISNTAIVVLSYFCCAKFAARYRVSRRIETLLQGIIFLAIGSNWFAGMVSFFSVLLGGESLGHVPVIWSWSWTPVVIATAWMYVTFSMIYPKLKNVATAFYGLINVGFLYLMYARTLDYSVVRSVGGLPSSEITGIAALFLFFDILTTIVIIGPMYLWIGFKSKRPVTQLKGKVIGIGVLLFAFFAIFETVLPPSAVLLMVSRITILFAILLMYLGFTLPEWLQKRLIGDKETPV